MTINDLLRRLVEELAEGEIPEPLTYCPPLGLVWADLARLAGEEPPPDVAALLDEPACVAVARR